MTRTIESACLYLLLIVIALRPLIPETYSSGRSSIMAGVGDLSDPSPVTTAIIDGVILLAALGWCLSRALGPAARYRRCGLEWGIALVAVAGLVSCWVAGNQRLAINAAVDWLCLPLVTIVLVQLLRTRGHVRLLLCALLASAAVQAYECVDQILYSFPETQRFYEQNKERIWAERGVDPDSSQAALYEARLASREAHGYLAHSNVTGAYLVMTGLAALALAWGRFRGPLKPLGRVFAGALLVVGLAILAASVLTKSKGALLAGAVAVVVWMGRHIWAGWFVRHRRRALALGWALVTGGVLACIGHGLYHGSLPGASLNFRWQYWTTSARLFADHYPTGVGRENFGRHYLQYKTIDSPEEVANPHNFLVGAAADWGLVGLVGVVLLLIGGTTAATRTANDETAPSERAAQAAGNGQPDEGTNTGSPLRWGLAIGGGLFVTRLFLLGSTDPNYLLVATVVPAVVWAIVFGIASLESNRLGRYETDRLPGLAIGINCCLLAFLLQDTINFGLFVPGSATTFFALLAVPIALRARTQQEQPGGIAVVGRLDRPALALIGIALALLLHLVVVVAPVVRADAWLARARRDVGQPPLGRYDLHPAYVAYDRAAQADPRDPTAPAECAAWLIRLAEVTPNAEQTTDRSLALMDAAIDRDPLSTPLHRRKMQIARQAHRLTGHAAYTRTAATAARRVTELYPNSPEAHADLGRCLRNVGRETNDRPTFTRAAEHLQRALDLDDARPEWERYRRLRPKQREEIEDTLADVEKLQVSP
ncbi:MAG: O-antigen ligase family protein [bacterium]|nr:O-antigen ligase family protein [bacterium]